MTHPVRRLIKITEGRLDELIDAHTGGKPPRAMSDEPGRRRDEGGSYWFHKGKKIAVDPRTDFAVQPLLRFREFGFNPDTLLTWLEQNHPYAAKAFAERDTREMPHPALRYSFLGARIASISYATSQGWGMLEFDAQQASLWCDQRHTKTVVNNAGSMFPMMNMERISVVLPVGNDVFPTKRVNFFREDSSSFSGAFGALMQWARGEKEPEQNWLYVIVPPSDIEMLGADGLHPKPGQFVRTGNWTDRDVYAMKFHNRLGLRHFMKSGDRVYRFPASIVSALGLQNGGGSEPMMFSKSAFVIPASIIQQKTLSGWKPING